VCVVVCAVDKAHAKDCVCVCVCVCMCVVCVCVCVGMCVCDGVSVYVCMEWPSYMHEF
jgi:hypothetical protein